jgi:hypothetical protein
LTTGASDNLVDFGFCRVCCLLLLLVGRLLLMEVKGWRAGGAVLTLACGALGAVSPLFAAVAVHIAASGDVLATWQARGVLAFFKHPAPHLVLPGSVFSFPNILLVLLLCQSRC